MERNSKRAKVRKPKSMKAAKPKSKFKFMSEEERAKKKQICAQMIQFLKAHSKNQPDQTAQNQVQQWKAVNQDLTIFLCLFVYFLFLRSKDLQLYCDKQYNQINHADQWKAG